MPLINENHDIKLGVQPAINPSTLKPGHRKFCPLTYVAILNKLDVAWFYNIHKIYKSKEIITMEPFDNIKSMTIERIYQNYLASNKQFSKIVNLGVNSIDLEKMEMRKTEEGGKVGSRFKVIRGASHIRQRSSNSNRFSHSITKS